MRRCIPVSTQTQFSDDEFDAALRSLLSETGYVSTRMLADAGGYSREPARRFLKRCHQANQLTKRQVGGSVNIYAPTNLGHAAVRVPDGDHESDAPTQTDTREHDAPAQNERLSFFPSRREIVVNEPTDHTRTVLSRTSHLVDQTGERYLYKVSKEGVWNTPYETFDELRDDLRGLVGEALENTTSEEIADQVHGVGPSLANEIKSIYD